MKLLFLILVFAANMIFRDGTVLGSLLLAILLTVMISIVLRVMSRAAHQGKPTSNHQTPPKRKTSRKKSARAITDGDIGPYVTSMLERGDHQAVIRRIKKHIPGSWPVRRDLIAVVEEHGRLQRSFRIANLAGVPMPEEATGFATQQIDLIADRARRMAFIHLHGAMNERIEASLTQLLGGMEPLLAQSSMLRADLAESTANPQWGEQQEKELLRKLARMSNTVQAMNSNLMRDHGGEIAGLDAMAPVGPESTVAASDEDVFLTPQEREVLALLAEGMSNPAIARALLISERSVTTHLSGLYAKLDVSTRTEAIALAMRTGLVMAPGEHG